MRIIVELEKFEKQSLDDFFFESFRVFVVPIRGVESPDMFPENLSEFVDVLGRARATDGCENVKSGVSKIHRGVLDFFLLARASAKVREVVRESPRIDTKLRRYQSSLTMSVSKL